MVEKITDQQIKNKVYPFLKHGNGRSKKLVDIPKKSYYDSILFILFEKTVAAISLILLLPISFVIALLIYVEDRKPVIFRQKRLGRYGKNFYIFKFRTMHKDAEKILKSDLLLYKKYLENDYKLPHDQDPRLLKIGHFLRRFSLDEIPQFFNVLKGDMSLVGPRPIVPDEIERYGEDAEEFLSVKPGITGLWQVTGRSDVPYPDRKYLDLLYIRNRTLRMDLVIIFKTIWKVIARDGAY